MSSGKHASIFCCFRRAVNKWKKIYISTKKKLEIFILFKSFQQPALNASCVLLEHQWMFEPFLIVVFESLNCPQCEKMDLKIIQSLLERVQICKNAGKLQNLQNVEDLSEEQCSVQLFRTNKGLMNNHHKTKEQSWIIQGNLTQY